MSSVKQLEELRSEIDEIDRKLMRLLKKRFKVVAQVARLKSSKGMGINDAAREREVIQNCKAAAKNIDAIFVERLMKLVLAQSRKIQRRVK